MVHGNLPYPLAALVPQVPEPCIIALILCTPEIPLPLLIHRSPNMPMAGATKGRHHGHWLLRPFLSAYGSKGTRCRAFGSYRQSAHCGQLIPLHPCAL